MSAYRFTRDELTMRIGSEVSNLASIVPGNRMDVRLLAANSRTAELKLREVANVLYAMVPHAMGGGMDEARELWFEYQQKWHPEESENQS
ncbi:hypothetical protein [Arthrobacter roseus]|uniref:hypothetical protein n=1 Tax=Arthrobacter roseus TaxID=136274 RepID=UPI0019631C93|nr:hypothetical protein [Arthrobacter roseus]MBM7847498.1 hypothetical protein [Arthrobacter roseus]